PDADTARAASDEAFRRIAELDDTMSDYKPTSELMQLCARAGGPPVAVSEDLFRVLAAAQDLAGRSDGAFDVTVGPVVRLWRRRRYRGRQPASGPTRLADRHRAARAPVRPPDSGFANPKSQIQNPKSPAS